MNQESNPRCFASDNNAGVHPDIMAAMASVNCGHAVAYGDDPVTHTAVGRFKEHFGHGIDVYFDNTGGKILEANLFQMNGNGRIVCCGAVSQYNTKELSSPRGLPGLMVVKRLKMQGFIVSDYSAKDAEAEKQMLECAATGKIKVVEDILDGLESAPAGLVGLLNGENRGKRMIRVAPDPA